MSDDAHWYLKAAERHAFTPSLIPQLEREGLQWRITISDGAGLRTNSGPRYPNGEAIALIKRLCEEVDHLRDAIEGYLLWDPRRAGHAAAQRRLAEAVRDGRPPTH